MDTIKVKVLRQKVLHDGLSMLVLKPGADNPPVPLDQIAGLVEEGAIEKPDGWEAALAAVAISLPSADGLVFSAQPPVPDPITTNLVRLVADEKAPLLADELLESQSLASLIAIAAAEGVIPDAEEMRLSLVEAIRDKRAGVGEFGEELLDAGGEGEGPGTFDHDGDGKPGGDQADDEVVDDSHGFVLTEAGGGWWHITGPSLEKPEKLRGEEDARARFDELVAAAATAGDAGGEGEAPA